MSYKTSAKNRRLKRTLLNIISVLKFESLNIETPKKIVLFGVIIAFFSLFLNWSEAIDEKHIGTVFKSFLGITGYILAIINVKIAFILLCQKTTERIKFFFNFHAKDGVLITFLGAFGLITTINTLTIIESFSYFTDGILIGRGIIVALIGYIFCMLGGMFMLRSKTKTSVYIDENDLASQTDENREGLEGDKNNMKLPF